MLGLNSMAGSVLLTGEDLLDKRIIKINTVEVPDIVNWVGEEEFLITTGYPFKDNEETIVDIIPMLAAKKVIGMALKPKRFIKEISDKMIEAAKANGFILIELSEGAVFSSIVRESLEQILAKEMVIMTTADRIAESVIEAVARSDGKNGPETALAEFSSKVGCAAYIKTEDAPPICPPGTQIPDAVAKSTSSGTITEPDGTVYRTAFREISVTGGESEAILVMFIKNREFPEFAFAAADRVLPVLSLEYGKAKSFGKIYEKYKTRFINEWLTDSFLDDTDICAAAGSYGMSISADKLYIVGVLTDSTDEQNSETFARYIRRLGRDHAVTFHNRHYVMVAEASGEAGRKEINELYTKIVNDTRIKDLKLCVSDPVSASDIPKAYAQAENICEICERCSISGDIVSFDELGIYTLLALLPQNNRSVAAFRDRFLKALKDYDAEHGVELVKTLICYYRSGSSIKLTAEKLYTHYNTVCYRLERIRNIIGADIDDEEIKLQIEIAIKLDKLRN